MLDTWKNCKPGLQFFHVSHIREITLICCHSAYVFEVQCSLINSGQKLLVLAQMFYIQTFLMLEIWLSSKLTVLFFPPTVVT